MASPKVAKITSSSSSIMVATAEIKTKWLETNTKIMVVKAMTWAIKLMAPNFNSLAKIMAVVIHNTVEVIKIMLVERMAPLINTVTKVVEPWPVACTTSSINNLVDQWWEHRHCQWPFLQLNHIGAKRCSRVKSNNFWANIFHKIWVRTILLISMFLLRMI